MTINHWKFLTFSILDVYLSMLLKTQTIFENMEYSFLVESTKIEIATFPFKIALREVNVKTNIIESAKWTYHKERNFASKYSIFSKILFQFKNLL